MKTRKILLVLVIAVLAIFMWSTKSNASYQSVNVVISSPENNSIQRSGKVNVEYIVYDVYMNVLNNELITHPEFRLYKNGQLQDSLNLGYIWKRGDWIKGGIELNINGGGKYTVDITCIPMNANTYSVDKRVSSSAYPAKTVSFYVYENQTATASFENSSINKNVGDEAFINEFTTSSDGKVRYKSSNTSVATVDSLTGEVTIKGPGTATITANVEQSYIYNEITKSYTITVTGEATVTEPTDEPSTSPIPNTAKPATSSTSKPTTKPTATPTPKPTTKPTATPAPKPTTKPTVTSTPKPTAKPTATPTPKATTKPTTSSTKITPTLKFTNSTVTKTVGDASFANGLTCNSDGKITYTSSNTNVAAVTSSGVIAIKSAGTTTITATSAETSKYKSGTASYKLVVNAKVTTSTSAKETPTFSLAFSNTTKTVGAAAFTNRLTTNTDGKITYTSSNTSVATVASNGWVTVKGPGEAMITVTSAETSKYKSASAFYRVTVTEPTPTPKSYGAPTLNFSK